MDKSYLSHKNLILKRTNILKDPERRTYFVTINFEHNLKYNKLHQPYKICRFSSLYANNVGQRDEGRKEKEVYLPVWLVCGTQKERGVLKMEIRKK